MSYNGRSAGLCWVCAGHQWLLSAQLWPSAICYQTTFLQILDVNVPFEDAEQVLHRDVWPIICPHWNGKQLLTEVYNAYPTLTSTIISICMLVPLCQYTLYNNKIAFFCEIQELLQLAYSTGRRWEQNSIWDTKVRICTGGRFISILQGVVCIDFSIYNMYLAWALFQETRFIHAHLHAGTFVCTTGIQLEGLCARDEI